MIPIFKPVTAVDFISIMSHYTLELFSTSENGGDETTIMSKLKKVENHLDLVEIVKDIVMPSLHETVIPAGTNICQIVITPRMEEMTFEAVDTLNNENRNGFGSTDSKKGGLKNE
ncbi:MAG: hypothetical protein ACRC45_03585, partial [Cetobacterium sp.]